jgi:hypothetical protein
MDSKKPIKDIDAISKELNQLNSQIRSISNKMMAVAMDYKTYLDANIKDTDIYELRDSMIYRLNAAKFHLEILASINTNTDLELTTSFRNLKSPNNMMGLNMHFENRVHQISYLSDSLIFHLVSGFDYISNLVEYICGNSKKKKLMWTQLAKSVRDKNNRYHTLTIADTIDKLNREFVGKLYDHRSYIIHTTKDKSAATFNIQLMEAKCESHIFSSQKFNNQFKELKSLSEDFNLTIEYVLFWLINKSVDTFVEILFSLKHYMENNKTVKIPFMIIKGPNNEILPISGPYWKDDPS